MKLLLTKRRSKEIDRPQARSSKKMTTCSCVHTISDYCLFSVDKNSETSVDSDKCIEAYTNCISEAKKCLNFTENPMSKEKLHFFHLGNDSVRLRSNTARCKQIAIGYNERGFMKYHKVDFDDAIADYTKALSYDSSLYFTYFNRGLIHYRLGRYEEAIADMKAALSIYPDFTHAQKCLAQAQLDLSQLHK